MFNLSVLTEDAQIALFLVVAENDIKNFEDKKLKESARYALDKCWEYLEKKNIKGDDLYNLIGSEDDNLVFLQADAETENDVRVWDCVIDSVLYTCRKAYDANDEYLPQAVEIANASLYDHIVSQYILLNAKNKETLKKIEMFFSNNYTEANKELNISDLKKLIAD